MKEIGGYFGIEQYKNNTGEYYKDLICLNTARNALVYLAKAKNIKKVYIPYMLCNSISDVCDRESIKYEFYHINNDLRPIFNKSLNDNEYLYIVNLYGQIDNNEILEYRNKYNNIIIDNTHAFYQKPVEKVDTIYSCRKFFGVPDGAYLYTDSILNKELEIDDSSSRTKHLYGRIKDGASAHYQEFKDNDIIFNDLKLMKMSNITHEMLRDIDYEKVRNIRTKNFIFLFEGLGSINKLNVKVTQGSFAYPFYHKDGLRIKKELATKGIYIPTLWPNVLNQDNRIEKDYAENILPLPCDQRYNIKEMEYMLEEIIRYV